MPENTAPTANPAAPAAESPENPAKVDSYGFPVAGDMSTDDMSDAELEAFVDQSLGIKSKGNTDAPKPPTEPETPAAGTPPAPNDAAASSTGTPAPQQPETPAKPAAELGDEPPALDTSDLWLEVTDTEGEKIKLNLEDGIPDDFRFTTDKQLFEVLDAFQEMKQLKADREAVIEKAIADRSAAESDQKTQQSTMTGWANEIDDLIDAGLISKAKAQPADGKAYTAAEIAADPGLKLTSEVFDYMTKENTKRKDAGRAPLTSFAAAFTLYKKENDKSAEATALKQKNDLAKQRGGMVGGTSAPAASDKGYVYKRGSARNIHQVYTGDI